MRALVVLLLFVTTSASFAQQGYVVTRKSDTLRGKVNVMSYDLVDRVQVNVNKKRHTFVATDLRAISIDSATLVPVRYNNSIRMMKVLRTGFLSYYAFKLPNQTSYDGRLLVKVGAPPQEVPNIGFKRIMGEYLAECDELATEIKNGDMSRREIESMVDRYNECIKRPTPPADPPSIPTAQPDNEVAKVIDSLLQRVEASSLPSKKDATEMLKDISVKTSRNETIPGYLLEGLKSAVAADADLKKDVEKLVALLQNK